MLLCILIILYYFIFLLYNVLYKFYVMFVLFDAMKNSLFRLILMKITF